VAVISNLKNKYFYDNIGMIENNDKRRLDIKSYHSTAREYIYIYSQNIFITKTELSVSD